MSTDIRFVSVFRGSTNQSTSNGVWTTVLFNVITTDGEAGTLYSSNDGSFIAPQTGWYDIEAQVTWASATAGAVRIIQGTDSIHPVYVRENTVAQNNNSIKYRLFMGTNDTVQVQVRQSSGDIDILASLDPGTLGQPAVTTSATFTLIKPSPSVTFNAF